MDAIADPTPEQAGQALVAAARAAGLAAVAPPAASDDEGPALVARFRDELAAGRFEAAIRVAVPRLIARGRDAAMRDAVFAALDDAPTRQALLPFVEHVIGQLPTPVVLAGLSLVGRARQGEDAPYGLASPLVWTAALQWLFEDLAPEFLREISARLLARFPNQEFLAELDGALAAVPPPVAGDGFRDRILDPAQLALSADRSSRVLLVCFCGFDGRIGMPLGFFHRWIARLPVHALYLRDPAERFYRDGLPGIGPDRAAIVRFVRAVAGELGVRSAGVYGNSMGGFVAVGVGVAIGAARIVCASGRMPGTDRARRRGTPEAELAAARQRGAAAVAERFAAAPRAPQTLCVYGAGSRADVADAESIAHLPGVRLMPLPERRRHNSGLELAKSGHLHGLLAWLAGTAAAPPDLGAGGVL